MGVKILSVESGADGPSALKVEFQRLNSTIPWILAKPVRVQTRISEKWQDPTILDLEEPFMSRTNAQQLSCRLLIPQQAEACRFLIEYRVGGSPYCKVFGYLVNSGFHKRFPSASKLVLKFVPHKPRLRHVEFELKIPEQSHQNLAFGI
jgi:hypothetical protein